MHRFFLNENNVIDGEVLKITASDFKHISYSLRMGKGDKLIVSDGKGIDYLVEIIEIREDELIAKILSREKNSNEAEVLVTLAQGIPKKNNMDFIIQKCTEIGVNKIIPLNTKRTIVKLSGKKLEKRLERWQKIAEEAAKQSGRALIPEIDRLYDLEDIISLMEDYDLVLIPWEGEAEQGLSDIYNKKNDVNFKKILIIIGPEGGFAESEVNYLKKNGVIPITLGPRILRTETAGLVALTMVLYQSGELGG
ncbi:MAG: 16S rRNA (uracil(1498)-N(3))-methyltransferase [Bacillota bacterium]